MLSSIQTALKAAVLSKLREHWSASKTQGQETKGKNANAK